MGLEPLLGTSLGCGRTHSKPPDHWHWGAPEDLVSLSMVKAESCFQAGPVSLDVGRSFTEDTEEQEDGAVWCSLVQDHPAGFAGICDME